MGMLHVLIHETDGMFLDSYAEQDYNNWLHDRTAFLRSVEGDLSQKWLLFWTGEGHDFHIIKHSNGLHLDAYSDPQHDFQVVTRPQHD